MGRSLRFRNISNTARIGVVKVGRGRTHEARTTGSSDYKNAKKSRQKVQHFLRRVLVMSVTTRSVSSCIS